MPGDQRGTKGLDELRVLVVDDHDLFRTGLRNLLEEEGVNVVGEAENGETRSASPPTSHPTS
jgi:DNA-binding NarL/FixJ family response regulator